ncbi:MAG: tetratricopeptide repeat protein [Dehalococcoidales bacterium]|jgi:hypothetical protein
MNTEVIKYPPFEIRVQRDLEHLKTYLTLYGTISKSLIINALVGELTADLDTRQIFFITYNADNIDGATLYSLKLDTGNLLWKIPDVPGGSIKLNRQGRFLDAGKPYGTNDPFIVRVSYDGQIIKRNARSGYEMMDMAKDLITSGHENDGVSILKKALTSSISTNTRAKAFRWLGEIADKAGDTTSAIELFEKAFALNSGIGVKKRLKALKGIR